MNRITLAVAFTASSIASAALPFAAQAQSTRQITTLARAEPGEVPLAAGGARVGSGEQWYLDQGRRAVHNVKEATLTPFLPSAGKSNGTAIIVAPGGGFMSLSMDSEGYDVARWLASRGITAFVLKYRLQPTPTTTEGLRAQAIALFTAGPAAQAKFLADARPAAIEDAAAAMRLVRSNAAAWRVDPKRVGFMGFSAGAITTIGLTLQSDDQARPDFIAPIYGPMGKPTEALPAKLPPMWTALSADDPLFGNSDLALLTAWRSRKAPYELHLFERGGHGWGFNGLSGTTSTEWRQEFSAWLVMHKLMAGQ